MSDRRSTRRPILGRRLLLAAVLAVTVLVAAGVVVGVQWWRGHDRSTLQEAVALAPEDAERVLWTDWAGIRDDVDAEVGEASAGGQVARFLSDAYGKDLTSTSALVESATILQRDYGFSPASIDWEIFSQSTKGAVLVLKVPESLSFDSVADNLASLGYTKPEAADGVWRGGADVLGRIGNVTPELSYLSLHEEDRLIFAGDKVAYTGASAKGATSGDGPTDLDEVVGALADGGDETSPLTAALFTAEYACGALAMSQADPVDQSEADDLIADSGEINPYLGFALAGYRGDKGRVAMSFETEEQARDNADSRAALAAGPAVGQGGDFADRLVLGRVQAQGDVLTMAFTAAPGAYPISDLSSGPVLFATC